MAAAPRRLAVFCIVSVLLCAGAVLAEGTTPPPTTPNAPASVADDAARLLELGKLLMSQNNPCYAAKPAKLDFAARNAAGDQAVQTFQKVVKLHPQLADGWLWLGIALTETLHYSKEFPQGQAVTSESQLTDGVQAFRTAYERTPTNLICVSYYGEALMVYKRDFAAAGKLWERYLQVASTDVQRVTALVQTARAILNAAYFGKADKTMTADQVRTSFARAESYVVQAAKLCPAAADVKEMQALLQQYRKTLIGK